MFPEGLEGASATKVLNQIASNTYQVFGKDRTVMPGEARKGQEDYVKALRAAYKQKTGRYPDLRDIAMAQEQQSMERQQKRFQK